jgi:hypothetical protein
MLFCVRALSSDAAFLTLLLTLLLTLIDLLRKSFLLVLHHSFYLLYLLYSLTRQVAYGAARASDGPGRHQAGECVSVSVSVCVCVSACLCVCDVV